jgi:V/A-type H+-transporting ATPase subunit E
MNVKLDSLIEKIKADGVDAANKQAEEIVAAAKKQAEDIVKKAKEQAEQCNAKAANEAEAYKKNAEVAINQAARDTVLVLKEKITKMLDQALLADVDAAMDKKFLQDLIVNIAEVWAKDGDVSVLANGVDVDALTAQLKAALNKSIKNTVEVKLDKKITHGFRIGKKDENLFYDFTDESVLEALRVFLNPKLAEILK